jgi:hypothetical protein
LTIFVYIFLCIDDVCNLRRQHAEMIGSFDAVHVIMGNRNFSPFNSIDLNQFAIKIEDKNERKIIKVSQCETKDHKNIRNPMKAISQRDVSHLFSFVIYNLSSVAYPTHLNQLLSFSLTHSDTVSRALPCQGA